MGDLPGDLALARAHLGCHRTPQNYTILLRTDLRGMACDALILYSFPRVFRHTEMGAISLVRDPVHLTCCIRVSGS